MRVCTQSTQEDKQHELRLNRRGWYCKLCGGKPPTETPKQG